MSGQPNLDPDEQAIADRLHEEHQAFYQQQREAQERRIEELESKRAADGETILHLRAVNAVLNYFQELTFTRFQDQELAAIEAVRASRKPIVRGDGTEDRDAMVAAVDDLVTRAPYLLQPLAVEVPDAPHGPSGAPCGSGRRYRATARDYASLKQRFPAAYPND